MSRPDRRSSKSRPYRSRLITKAVYATWMFALTKPLATLSIVILVSIMAAALLADVVSTHDPLAHDASERLRPPGADHYFGTDGFGRDVFSRVIHGARVSLLVGFLSVTISSTTGVWVGTTSAYVGGKFDLITQRVVDVLLGFPFLVVALIMVVSMGVSITSVTIAIALAQAPQVARVARASTLTIKEESYIEATRIVGAGTLRIIRNHVLPNSLPTILAQVTGYFGTAVGAETAMSFLGLGVPPPYPSWGRMLQEGVRQYFEVAPWVTIFPGLALSLTVLAFALLGDTVRDLLNPRDGMAALIRYQKRRSF